jgi:hypothetical protein
MRFVPQWLSDETSSTFDPVSEMTETCGREETITTFGANLRRRNQAGADGINHHTIFRWSASNGPVRGNDQFDACYETGLIVGLDPKGDGFLSVRSGPGGKPYREIDRRYGQQVQICDDRGPCMAVVYDPSGSLEACWVRSPDGFTRAMSD